MVNTMMLPGILPVAKADEAVMEAPQSENNGWV
jgi:hypothetical protein